MQIERIGPATPVLRGVRNAPSSDAVSSEPKPRADAATTSQESTDRREIAARVEKANSEMSSLQQDLRFSIHEASGEMVVQVVDSSSGKVLRQSPPKEFLDLSVRLHEMVGYFLDAKK